MERNEMSFSIPTWRREEIKSIGLAEEQALYMTSPYNLNDFKNGQQSVEYIFTPNEESSEMKSFIAKRELNPKVSKEVAIFTTFLYQIILNDNSFNSSQRLPATEKNLQDDKNNVKLLGVFKQKLMQLNLCQLNDIPKEFQNYYRNEIIKKIIFQYFGKCAYNISLIEILLINNDFLRFAVEVCVKSVLYEGTLLAKFTDIVEFQEEVKMFVNYFSYLFLMRKDEQTIKHSNVKSKKIFACEQNALKTEHYLLKETKDNKIFLYRKQIKVNYQLQIQQNLQNKVNEPLKKTPKQPSTPKFKTGNYMKQKIRQLKAQAQKQSRKKDERGGFFSCLPCFKRN